MNEQQVNEFNFMLVLALDRTLIIILLIEQIGNLVSFIFTFFLLIFIIIRVRAQIRNNRKKCLIYRKMEAQHNEKYL